MVDEFLLFVCFYLESAVGMESLAKFFWQGEMPVHWRVFPKHYGDKNKTNYNYSHQTYPQVTPTGIE